MKVAVIDDLMSKNSDKRILVNIGDYLQLYVVEDFLHKFIDADKIISLNINDLISYEGEEAILVMQWNIFDSRFMINDRIAISNKLHPLWLSACSSCFDLDSYYNEYNIEYLRKCEPIACRDEITRDRLRKYGLKAFNVGCMTVTIPRIERRNPQKVFLVDAPFLVRDFIPNELMKKAECFTQQYYFQGNFNKKELRSRIVEQYRKYKEEAKLIITSRLHVAAPCLAMGIPIIMCKDIIDDRFGFLDQIVKLYDSTMYDQIDWRASVVDLEIHKKRILNLHKQRIIEEKEKIANKTEFSNELLGQYEELDRFYSTEKERKYKSFQEVLYKAGIERVRLFLKKNHYDENSIFDYAIFGCGELGSNTYCFINEVCPKANLRYAIDNFLNSGVFHGKDFISLDNYLDKRKDEVIFVCSVGGTKEIRNINAFSGNSQAKICYVADTFINETDL